MALSGRFGWSIAKRTVVVAERPQIGNLLVEKEHLESVSLQLQLLVDEIDQKVLDPMVVLRL